MKTTTILLAAILLSSVCSAQTIGEIGDKYNADNWLKRLNKAQTVFAKMSYFSEDDSYFMTLRTKTPDKFKIMIYADSSVTFNSYDGKMKYSFIHGVTDGYWDNQDDVIASNEPPESDAGVFLEQIGTMLSYVEELFKTGGFTIENQDELKWNDGTPVLTLRGLLEEDGEQAHVSVYVDKNSYRLKGLSITVTGDGGVMLTLDKLDIDINLDDSVFKIEL